MKDFRKRLPTFLLIGAAKAGTTSLYAYLNQHPDIYFSVLKEPHFFDDDDLYVRGGNWYIQEFFPRANAYETRGEATPFLHLPDLVCERIRETYGRNTSNVKFIVVLRDPVERAWSHYLDRRRNCVEQLSFEDALAAEGERLRANSRAWVGYFRDGLYAQQISKWFRFFSRSQFLFLLNEDLRNEPEHTIQIVTDFLEVPPIRDLQLGFQKNMASKPRSRLLMRLLSNPPKFTRLPARKILPVRTRRAIRYILKQKNTQPYAVRPEPNKNTAHQLRNRYVEDIQVLEKLIDRNLTSWYQSVL